MTTAVRHDKEGSEWHKQVTTHACMGESYLSSSLKDWRHRLHLDTLDKTYGVLMKPGSTETKETNLSRGPTGGVDPGGGARPNKLLFCTTVSGSQAGASQCAGTIHNFCGSGEDVHPLSMIRDLICMIYTSLCVRVSRYNTQHANRVTRLLTWCVCRESCIVMLLRMD